MQNKSSASSLPSKFRIILIILATLIAFLGIAILIRHYMIPSPRTDGDAHGPWPHSTSPVMHPDGRAWRIGYYEGGPWVDYPEHLAGLINGLMKLGWIENVPIPSPDPSDNTGQIWEWLSTRVQSRYLSFPSNACWSADWDEQKREELREKLLGLLKKEQLDLIIAMGTWAGQDLANNQHSIPVIVCSTSDPIEAGIIKSADDSGYDHVHAMCDPDKFYRQISAFHNIVNFNTLGIVYDDTREGRVYAALKDVKRGAAERGFTLMERHVPENNLPEEQLASRVKQAFAELAPHVEGMWIVSHLGQSHKHMPDILDPLFTYNVPSWSLEGSVAVKRGVLLSVAEADLKDVGFFYARVAASVFNGVKPRDIRQRFRGPLALSVNLETARRINFEVPETLLEAADSIFEDIETKSDQRDNS